MYGSDAFENNKKEKQALMIENDKCDKYDYLVAVACGAIGGLVDIFLVGAPGDTILGNWTDKQVNNVVMAFAKTQGWKSNDNVKSAIGYLERHFGVNYDQRKAADVNYAFDISPSSHHMMSLAHSSDIIGLFFSILNQFTSTSSFIVNGSIITISTKTFELQGSNFISKIFCGIFNWFAHLMSDVAGSSGSHGRGVGIVIPFYELFGLCNFGSFDVNGEKKTLAEIAMNAFTYDNGTKSYDFRFGLAQAIPVVLMDLCIRTIWAIRRHFQYGKPVKECIPTNDHPDLRVMLIVGNGTLCAMDGIDAAVRSGGNFLMFFMRLNLIAWFRFIKLVLKEVCIRLGIAADIQALLDSFRRVNEGLAAYLEELKKIDYEAYKMEVNKYQPLADEIQKADDEETLNKCLLGFYDRLGIEKPWKGDFDEFMSDRNNKLVFS